MHQMDLRILRQNLCLGLLSSRVRRICMQTVKFSTLRIFLCFDRPFKCSRGREREPALTVKLKAAASAVLPVQADGKALF